MVESTDRIDKGRLHGKPPRGLMATMRSPLFQGFFGRMFRALPPANFGTTEAEVRDNLDKLASKMVADFDAPKDGEDEEESGIPSLYTYLGQFIDHDLTFDPSPISQKEDDPDALVDFRTPAFDLDNVYGRGPDDQPYIYDGNDLFLLGKPLRGGDANAQDLPRNAANPARALIGDPRNDENAIVSQLQGLLLRFHNRMRNENPKLPFVKVQQLVRHHYQYVVLHDFLKRIVHASVLSDLQTNGRYDKAKIRFYQFQNFPFMPVEFSAAAYRLGHSMVRPGYRLNDSVLLPIFPVPSEGQNEGLTGFREMNPEWGIDWGRFIDIDIRAKSGSDGNDAKRLQFAYRLDTSAVAPLGQLPSTVAADVLSLPLRNLLRGWLLGLPSGQSVARAMHVTPLSDSEILIGKFLDPPKDPHDAEPLLPVAEISPVFANNCPLWTYILAETRKNVVQAEIPVLGGGTVSTPQLGAVGGRIVAEVFIGIMFGDKDSLLNIDPLWVPTINGKSAPNYALKDFVSFALGK